MVFIIDLSYNMKDTLKRDLGLINEQYNMIYYDVEIKMLIYGLFG